MMLRKGYEGEDPNNLKEREFERWRGDEKVQWETPERSTRIKALRLGTVVSGETGSQV